MTYNSFNKLGCHYKKWMGEMCELTCKAAMSCRLSHCTRELVMLRACSTGKICLILWTSFGLVRAAFRIFPFCGGREIGSPGWAPMLFGWLLLFWLPFELLVGVGGPLPFVSWLWPPPPPLELLVPLVLLPFDLSPFPAPRFPFLCLRYFTYVETHGKHSQN